ncbi:MAG: hypothetical protein AAF570_07950, partial [Bacteroidota bacterium]
IVNTVYDPLDPTTGDNLYYCENVGNGAQGQYDLPSKIQEVKLTAVQADGVIIIGTVDIGTDKNEGQDKSDC